MGKEMSLVKVLALFNLLGGTRYDDCTGSCYEASVVRAGSGGAYSQYAGGGLESLEGFPACCGSIFSSDVWCYNLDDFGGTFAQE